MILQEQLTVQEKFAALFAKPDHLLTQIFFNEFLSAHHSIQILCLGGVNDHTVNDP